MSPTRKTRSYWSNRRSRRAALLFLAIILVGAAVLLASDRSSPKDQTLLNEEHTLVASNRQEEPDPLSALRRFATAPAGSDVSDWDIYRNERYDFSLRFPPGGSVQSTQWAGGNLDNSQTIHITTSDHKALDIDVIDPTSPIPGLDEAIIKRASSPTSLCEYERSITYSSDGNEATPLELTRLPYLDACGFIVAGPYRRQDDEGQFGFPGHQYVHLFVGGRGWTLRLRIYGESEELWSAVRSLEIEQ